MDTHPRTRAPEEPNNHDQKWIREWKGSQPDAQAACCFRCSASKRTPFFQTSKVIAAILRAKVRRAIDSDVQLLPAVAVAGDSASKKLVRQGTVQGSARVWIPTVGLRGDAKSCASVDQ